MHNGAAMALITKQLVFALLIGTSCTGFVHNDVFAKTINDAQLAAWSIPQLQHRGAAALQQGALDHAKTYFAEAGARQPRDATSQTLLAFAYHLDGETNPASLDMALAGYDLAIRSESGQFLPLALAGYASYQQGRYSTALDYFSRALLLRPHDEQVMLGLAASAYMIGEVDLASVAIERAIALKPQTTVDALRLAVYSNAASNNQEKSKYWLSQLTQYFPEQANATGNRMMQLVQTAGIDSTPVQVPLSSDISSQTSSGLENQSFDINQISLDVAIVLSQNTKREHQGINLLDGLNLQYGFARDVTHTVNRTLGEPISKSFQRVITKSIGIPQLNYNLNLFNRNGQFYSVVARPQLTAFQGEESEFFVGRSFNVAVGGVNTSTLEKIDVGIEMRVTPIEITPEKTRVRIEAGRSFLTTDIPGTFKENLTTFRQRVVATAEIRFGETLLLSGLNENVNDHTFSKTPLLGSIPLLKNLFHEQNTTERQDSVLVLVTPSLPVSMAGKAWARSEHVKRLTDLWTQVIDPMSNAQNTQKRLENAAIFSRMIKQDTGFNWFNPKSSTQKILNELAPVMQSSVVKSY